MKKQLLLLSFLIATNVIFAQSPIDKGQLQFNAGLGLSSWGVPIYIGADYGIHEDITIGGELSFRSYREDYFAARYRHSVIGISGNGNYHFNRLLNIPSEWDFYAGLNLGFYILNSSNGYPGSTSSGLGLGAQVGGRYYFNDQFGINLEIGGSNAFSGSKFGVTLRL